MILDEVDVPIVLAPMAGGPSTPALTAAVAEAGGLAFLAAGYLSSSVTAERIAETRRLTDRPIGVNLFAPGTPAASGVVAEYAARLAPEAQRAGVRLGDALFDDDAWAAKLQLLLEHPVPVVSVTFGCPSADEIAALHRAGTEVWVTVTTPGEAAHAEQAGADLLVAQGSEAGGHRGTWDDAESEDAAVGVLALVQLVRARTRLPVVATGGIMTAAGVAAVLAAGAVAASLGTAFMRCPEAGTSAVVRAALRGDAPTALTRAFTGRLARGIRNRLLDEHSAAAPSAYPEIHHLTGPLRQAGRERGDADLVNLWAGQGYQLAEERPAAEVVARLAASTSPG